VVFGVWLFCLWLCCSRFQISIDFLVYTQEDVQEA
jgi:hypothetical protein